MLRLSRDGAALAYEEAGSGAPPILLVHDLGSDHTCFAPQFEHFRRHHRVVAVDLRGHGQSDKPSQALTVAVLADDLAWLCYELGLYRPVVLGHGLGAMVALDLAARYQDLPAAIVAVTPAASPSVPLALPQDVAAPLLMSISGWDQSAAAEGCVVPVLQLALGARDVAPDSSREASPQLAVRLGDAGRQREQMALPVEINLLVERFLSGRGERASRDLRAE